MGELTKALPKSPFMMAGRSPLVAFWRAGPPMSPDVIPPFTPDPEGAHGSLIVSSSHLPRQVPLPNGSRFGRSQRHGNEKTRRYFFGEETTTGGGAVKNAHFSRNVGVYDFP